MVTAVRQDLKKIANKHVIKLNSHKDLNTLRRVTHNILMTAQAEESDDMKEL